MLSTKHLPGISKIYIGTDEAIIFYKDESKNNTRISADNTKALLELLSSFLVPIEQTQHFSTVQQFNKACESAEESTLEVPWTSK